MTREVFKSIESQKSRLPLKFLKRHEPYDPDRLLSTGSEIADRFHDFFGSLKAKLAINRPLEVNIELFSHNYENQVTRPQRELIEACGLQTTRSALETTTPNLRHTHDLSLHLTDWQNVIAIQDEHTISMSREVLTNPKKNRPRPNQKLQDGESTTTNTSYLTEDGWFVSSEAIKDPRVSGKISQLLKDRKLSKLGPEASLIYVIFEKLKKMPDIWKVVATKLSKKSFFRDKVASAESRVEVKEFFQAFQEEAHTASPKAEPLRFYDNPLSNGTLRPSKALLSACALPTTRDSNKNSANPHIRHQYEYALESTGSPEIVAIRCSHAKIERSDDSRNDKEQYEEHNYYLTRDGWLIDGNKAAEEIGEYEGSIAWLERQEQRRNKKSSWKKIARKLEF